MTRKGSGGFKFAGTGLVAILALLALGGGVFFVLKNQNNPIFNVTGGQGGSGTGGSGGSGTGGQAIAGKDIAGRDKVSSGDTPSPSSLQNPSSSELSNSPTFPSTPPSATNIDLKTTRNWAFKFPVYRIDKEGKCTKLPSSASADLFQSATGALSYQGIHNFYGYNTSIQGTITSSAKTNLLLNTNESKFTLGFESKEVKVEGNEIVVTGEALPEPNCPKGTFELRTKK
ncbi:MAG: hypothetical protein HC789_11540 [Microcoleus sp. CSU_2_2]|nr:hypothetical protein [Microcoleus sp. SU_5_3]NJS10947.1 hypothetical protein [Microcoleus sp. CSU_2_2]